MSANFIGLTGLILAALVVWALWRPRPRLVIGERGILDRSLGRGWIRWEEIDGAYHRSTHEQQAVILRLRGACSAAGGLGRDVRLDLRGTGVSPAELLREIMTRGRPAC